MGCGLNPTAVLVILLAGVAMAQDSLSNAATRPPSMLPIKRMNIYYKKGEKIDLVCTAEGNPKPVYYWLKNGALLNLTTPENKERMSLYSGVGSLMITDAKDEDEGIYQCVAENAFGKSFSIKRNVKQAWMKPFQSVKDITKIKQRVLIGRSIMLKCDPPDSIPAAKISWIIKSDDYDVDEEPDKGFDFVKLDDRITMDWKGNLYITNVQEGDGHDGSKYVCMANNKVVRSLNQGSDKILDPFGLKTDEPVTLMWNSTRDVLGLLGKRVKFKCIFAGNPQPRITWNRIGGKIDGNRMAQSDDGFEFEIKRVKYDDAGQYECAGRNTALKTPQKVSFKLTVESKPIWTSEPKDVTVGVEENAVITCSAKGRPTPTVQWYINGNPIESEPPNARRKLNGNNLEFSNLSKSDSQVIQCNATNKHGFLWSDVFLHVLAIPAKVEKKPAELLKVAEGQKVTITCESTGKPKPKVIWFKGDQELSGARHIIQDNGNLVIMDVTDNDSGNYKCFARNRFGKDSANGNLVVREKTKIDASPLDLKLIHGSEATFVCGASTDPHEKLEYIWLRDGQRIDDTDPRVDIMDGTLTILDINSQDTGDYVCMATNGLDNATATAKLEVEAPPDPPYDVVLVSCFSVKATVKWKFNSDQENFSPLQNFIVEYNTSFNPKEWVVGNRPAADNRQTDVKLSLWVKYNFRVKAVNAIGVGKPSERNSAVCQTPQGRPNRHPRKVTTNGEKTNFLVVEWEPMPQIEHNAPDFFYNITVKEKDGDLVMNFVERDYTVGRKEIFVNKIYKPYEITVRAQNQVGQPFIPAQTIDGFSGEAEPKVVPENFELDPDKNVTATSAGFRWDPVDTGTESMQGEFKGYKVRFWKADQKDSTMHEVFIPHTKSRRRRRQMGGKIKAEVRNLPSYSEIEADVVAVNNYFSSNGSNIVNFSTPEGVPSAVEYVEALYRGSTHFLLEWGEPVEPNGNVTGYKVGYRMIDGLDLGDLEVGDTVTRRRVFLGGLTPDRLYRVYVWGLTKEGQGEDYYIDVRTAESSSALAIPIITKVMAGDTSVNVSWTLPEIDGIRVGAHYFLEYRSMGESKWKRVLEEENENFWQQIEGLQEASTYQVRVAAVAGQAGTPEFTSTSSEHQTFTTGGVGGVVNKKTIGVSNFSYRREGAKKANLWSAGWFIGMMVAIAILLLILIIVCIIKRNRGDKYHVQEKERLRGSNPDDGQDHFNEYAKSDENGVGQSNSFENNPEKMPLEYDETDSMEDYGDVDPGKFNEDGSFIGQYGAQKSSEAANASAMSTLV